MCFLLLMMKKSVGLFFASLMFLSLFSFVVSAANPVIDPIVNFAKSIGSDWNQGAGFSFGVAKLFIFIILWILIVSVLDKFPGLNGQESGKKTMRFFLSFAIAFISSAYFTATEIAVIVSSYSALGFVLGGIVPFMIMVFWSSSVLSSMKSASSGAKTWTLRAMWILFGVYFLYKAISTNGASGFDGASWVIWAQWLIIILSFVIVLFTPFIIRGVVREETALIGQLAVEDAKNRAELRAEKAKNIEALKTRIDTAKGVKSK